jgi:hypothetical protein
MQSEVEGTDPPDHVEPDDQFPLATDVTVVADKSSDAKIAINSIKRSIVFLIVSVNTFI